MKSVAILVPVYGVEKYIAECAESLFRQTYQNITYVFVNDCTKDRSLEVLEEVIKRFPERSDRVRIVHQEHNTGIGGARARGLKEVDTDYFIHVDSDDVIPEKATEEFVKRIEETGADMVTGAYREIRNGKLGKLILPFHGSQSSYRRKLLCQNTVSHNATMNIYRASVLEKLPVMFFEGIDYAEDLCATCLLSSCVTRAWTDAPVYYYRMDNESSYTQRMSEKNLISAINANHQVLKFFRQFGHLPLSLEIGILNMFRVCIRYGYPLSVIDSRLNYYPEHHIIRLIYNMLHKGGRTQRIGDFIYRVLRLVVARPFCRW